MKIGGIYAIEDVNASDLLRYQRYFSSTKLWVSYIMMRQTEGRRVGDNTLIIIRKTIDVLGEST